MSQRFLATAAFAAALAASAPALAADITGAGATFPYPIYAKWADAYKKATGTGMNYQSIGSGGGIKQITAKTVNFGASDMPMKPEDLEKNGLMQFPAIMGGVVPEPSERCTTVMVSSGSFTPGFRPAMAASFHFFTLPR